MAGRGCPSAASGGMQDAEVNYFSALDRGLKVAF